MNVIECCKCRNSPRNRRALSPANRSRLIFSCPLPSLPLPPRLRVRSADSPPSFPWEVPFRLRAVPLLCPFHVPSTLTIDWNFGVCEGEGEGKGGKKDNAFVQEKESGSGPRNGVCRSTNFKLVSQKVKGQTVQGQMAQEFLLSQLILKAHFMIHVM